MNFEQHIEEYDTNYIEYVLYNDLIIHNNNNNIYKTTFNENTFNNIKMKLYNIYKSNKKNIQYFTKKYKQYIDDNIEYSIFNDKERSVTIYGKELKSHINDVDINKLKINNENNYLFDINIFKQNYYVSNFKKKNLIHSLFNWGDNLNNIYEVNRLSFLYKDKSGYNKLYINLDTYIYENDDKLYNSIYINFNYNKLKDFNNKYNLLKEFGELMK